MSGGKETPRQKMIGMMYLVLTALLAMNVSKEVINAFVTIDDGQQKTLIAVNTKIGSQTNTLAGLNQENPAKYGDAFNKVSNIEKKATELVKHINMIKAKTFGITMTGDVNVDLAEYYDGARDKILITLDSIKNDKGVDNYDINTHLMIVDGAIPSELDDPDGNNYTAVVLRNKLLEFKDYVTAELQGVDGSATLISNLESTFYFPTKEEAKEGKKGEDAESWIVKNFNHVPLAASTAILTTLQSNIRSAHSDAIDLLFTEVEGSSYKFTALKSAVIPVSTTVTTGATFDASVFLAAYDNTNIPTIQLGKPGVKYDSINNKMTGEFDVLETDPEGLGIISIPASGVGPQHREGVIIFKPVGGDEVRTSFALDYTVVAPTLVVSPTKMNVFYKGIPNPVSVSLPGFKSEDIIPRISNGSISKGGEGGYTVNVKSGTEANISVTATLPDGSTKVVGPVNFRVKKIPDPTPSFARKGPSDNTVKKADFSNARGLVAKMENFDFEVNVKVASFKMVFVKDGNIIEKVSNSNKVTSEMQANMKKVRSGEKVYIESIKVKMPDGTTRKVSNLSLKIVN